MGFKEFKRLRDKDRSWLEGCVSRGSREDGEKQWKMPRLPGFGIFLPGHWPMWGYGSH